MCYQGIAHGRQLASAVLTRGAIRLLHTPEPPGSHSQCCAVQFRAMLCGPGLHSSPGLCRAALAMLCGPGLHSSPGLYRAAVAVLCGPVVYGFAWHALAHGGHEACWFCTLQASGAASLNQGPTDVELAKPFFDGQQLVQEDREPPGQEAAARRASVLRVCCHPCQFM